MLRLLRSIRIWSCISLIIGLVSNSTGKYYVPVPSWTKTFKAAGTFIYHYMNHKNRYNDAEIISARGPTNEALQAKVI